MVRKSVAVFAAAVVLASLASTAHAQLGVYGTVTVGRLTGVQNSPVATPGVSYNSNVNPLGGTGGIYYDFKNYGPIRLGVDVRGTILTSKRGAEETSNGAGTRVDSGLGGVRASFHTPILGLKPYAEAMVGIGRSNYGIILPTIASNGLKNNVEYHVFGGLDYKILPIMDWRAVELGYGGLEGGGHNYPLKSVSTGVVFHFPPPL
ncbi:hypothetical protein FTO74_10285 [Granulicella sp. WH15]|uniref:hypothetical protein n=1 Tax=Granulicella sp. WH15 TaxID=2602070 RepID=UPI0013673043|nr:hypothetical protein [Granulicella sp. WH15]QHN03714.1 hypothetical protein FTO74_10285 [Granulicella sp. WH15]